MRCKCGGVMMQYSNSFVNEDGEVDVEYEAECDDCGRLVN